MNPDWRSRYEVMIEAARAAGQVALGYFDRGVAVEWKADRSPVTVADREAEQALRARITQAFPGDGFLGEEFGDTASTTGYRWIIGTSESVVSPTQRPVPRDSGSFRPTRS